MYLSFDEWNVWFHSNEQDKKVEKWTVAPPLLEDIYTFEDALVAGCLLITLLRHCDRVKIACLAQLVNVIAPIMTETGGRAWAQTIYHPFRDASRYGRGTALNCRVDCPTYDGGTYGETPTVEAVAVTNGDELTVLAVNRSLTEDGELSLDLRGFGEPELVEHRQLWHEDLKAVNTADKPENVAPSAGDGRTLRRHSWNVLRYKLK
jgi:alpha-N-arabinofuranosidase